MRKSDPEVIKIDPSEEKEIIFWPENLTEEIKRDWPVEMRKEGGFQLGRVQQGERVDLPLHVSPNLR